MYEWIWLFFFYVEIKTNEALKSRVHGSPTLLSVSQLSRFTTGRVTCPALAWRPLRSDGACDKVKHGCLPVTFPKTRFVLFNAVRKNKQSPEPLLVRSSDGFIKFTSSYKCAIMLSCSFYSFNLIQLFICRGQFAFHVSPARRQFNVYHLPKGVKKTKTGCNCLLLYSRNSFVRRGKDKGMLVTACLCCCSGIYMSAT